MSTPASITAILNWQQQHAGQVPYSETASTRLDFDSAHLLSPTDCSGMAARMFRHFAGINPGTYTGNECDFGVLITRSHEKARNGEGMLPGDVILFDWDGGAWDHIAIYAGGGRIWNHGGPGYGPLNWSLEDNVRAAVKVMVRRWVQPSAPTPGGGASHDNNDGGGQHEKRLRRPWPAYMGHGDYFGLASGGNHSRGGVNREERPDVLAIKHRLHVLGYGGMNLQSHYFGEGAKAAVAKWQRQHYASTTTNPGQVWHDDWKRLFTW